jgi:SAM-dependent methyltransferase
MPFAHILAAAYGWPGPPLAAAVHPDDEMLAVARRQAADEEHALDHYFRIGNLNDVAVQQILAWAGCDWRRIDATLDFAAGYGRLTRFLSQRLAPSKVWASDLMPSAVAFQRATFGVHTFASATDPAALRWPARFDLIVVISLFTHLPRSTFALWLRHLAGALADGGLLVFTTHGPELFAEGWRRPLDADLFFEPVSENATLSPQDYGRTYVRPDFVSASLRDLPGVELLAHVPRGLGRGQDVFVVGRGRPRPRARLVLREPPQAGIDGAESIGGAFRVAGWAVDADGQPVRRAWLFGDATLLGEVTPGRPRSDLATLSIDAARAGGWTIDVPQGTPWPEWLVLVVEDAHGWRGVQAQRVEHLLRDIQRRFAPPDAGP